MQTEMIITDERTIALARQFVYRFLSIALSDPSSARWKQLFCEPFQQAASTAAGILRESAALHPSVELASGECPADSLNLQPMLESLGDPDSRIEEEHQQIFSLVMSKRCPPNETEYCRQTLPVYRSQMLADIAGFYRAFGLEPSRDRPERHDHISLELEFMAWLIAKAEHSHQAQGAESTQTQTCVAAQRRFFEQHLVWWVPAFAHAVRKRVAAVLGDTTRPTFYGALAGALAALICIERNRFGVPAPRELAEPEITQDTDSACEGCAGACGSAS